MPDTHASRPTHRPARCWQLRALLMERPSEASTGNQKEHHQHLMVALSGRKAASISSQPLELLLLYPVQHNQPYATFLTQKHAHSTHETACTEGAQLDRYGQLPLVMIHSQEVMWNVWMTAPFATDCVCWLDTQHTQLPALTEWHRLSATPQTTKPLPHKPTHAQTMARPQEHHSTACNPAEPLPGNARLNPGHADLG